MILQLMNWIEQGRLIVDETDNVYIKNGNYKVQEFIPNIEIDNLEKGKSICTK